MQKSSPSKRSKQPAQNDLTLYEVPSCTICLVELTENLFSLSCGHVFHGQCIEQHFHYKNTCPNCQKRCQQTEFRPVIMNFHSNNDTKLRQIMNQVGEKDQNVVMDIMNKLKTSLDIQEKLSYENQSLQKTVDSLRQSNGRLKAELEKASTDITKLTQKNSVLTKANEQNNRTIFRLCNELDSLKEQVQFFKKFEEQSKMFKILKQNLEKNNEEVTGLKNQFVQKQNYIEGLECFYFKLMQEKLDTAKARKETRMREQIIKELKADNNRLKREAEMQKNKADKILEDMNRQSAKYDKLKKSHSTLNEMVNAQLTDGDKINIDSSGADVSQVEVPKPTKRTSDIFQLISANTPVSKGPSMTQQIGSFGGLVNRKKVLSGGQTTLFG